MSDSLRLLRRNPRFAAVAVLILAVGIGACTAMFSIVHAVLLRPMALPAADRVVMLWSIDVRHNTVIESTYETQADFRARLRSFDEVALMGSVNWGGSLIIPGREPVHLSAACVSGTFFQALGSSPLLGRVFDAKDDEPQAERRLVLSHGTWTQFFGADPSVIGRKVMLREEAIPQPFEVIGVMPPEFFFPRGAQVPGHPRRRAWRQLPVTPDSLVPTSSASSACSMPSGDSSQVSASTTRGARCRRTSSRLLTSIAST